MIKQQLKNWVASSRAAPLAVFPIRLDAVVRHNAQTISRSVRWLFQSREHTNFTYDLTPLNSEHLVWFITAITHCSVRQARGYLDEILADHALRAHVQAVTAASKYRRLADKDVRFGTRIGWYALVRAFKPQHVVETGTDKGLGAVVFAAALLRNGSGRLTTIDVNPDAGYLITGRYATVIDRRIGDSLSILAGLDSVDLFLHDSDHAAGYEAAELAAVTPNLTDRAVVLSDNAQHTNELAAWSETHGRRFLFFDEEPADHWYPGDGIGVSLPPVDLLKGTEVAGYPNPI